MSCDHDMANGTCSICDPYVVQNLRDEVESLRKQNDLARAALKHVLYTQQVQQALVPDGSKQSGAIGNLCREIAWCAEQSMRAIVEMDAT